MSLEQLVAPIEDAKRLKDLKLKQDSLFYWLYYHGVWTVVGAETLHFELQKGNRSHCSAFLAEELMEIIGDIVLEKYTCKTAPRYCAVEKFTIENHAYHGKIATEALARACEDLIEKGIVKP